MKERLDGYFRLARDNLITFTTIVIALYAFIRDQFEPYVNTDVPFLLAVVVGLLGLNAVDGLIDRQVKLRELGNKVEQLGFSINGIRLGSSATQLLLEQVDIPSDRLKRAARIYWTGVTLRSTLRLRLNDLEFALAHGSDLRILIIDPSSDRLKQELAFREQAKIDYIDAVLMSTMLNLQILAEKAPADASFRLGLHRNFPAYGLTILDPDDPDGVCYVELYHPLRKQECVFVVHATADAAWFRFFVDQFHAMAQQAAVFEIRSPGDVDAAAATGADGRGA
jgi:hypothetical protein